MKIGSKLVEASHVRRLNRFSCLVSVEGKPEAVYLPNSGRLVELLVPGRRVFLREKGGAGRKTRYDMIMASVERGLVCVDSRAANGLFCEAIGDGKLDRFMGHSLVRREVTYGRSRLDFLLEKQDKRCYVEVKSVTQVEENLALFPDAPTARGTRHLEDLARAREEGYDAVVVFVVQREGAERFGPNAGVDPTFAAALRRVGGLGVAVCCYGCRVGLEEIEVYNEVPVCL